MVLCLAATAAACGAFHLWSAPSGFSAWHAARVAALAAATLGVLRSLLLERSWRVSLGLCLPTSAQALCCVGRTGHRPPLPMPQAVQVPETALRYPHSAFLGVQGLQVHFTHHSGSRQAPPGQAPLAVHQMHGFGANTGSWDYCQRQLAERLQADVTAHDTPGFGLTQRCAGPC